ncbi:MAG: sigma 54-interacting transcriptional regulator, partial [Clostridia bacterium]|nr:sigma 54-interacting transcriptional regulator [Clostridia bacterium]
CMYKFAVQSGAKEKDAPFIIFNCADYADNPQLLLAQLFGYVQGAYTGAETSKEGLVEKANNGILFLDEVHRLPSEGQEILFNLIDKGKFRRLGETDGYSNANVLIIAATTEDVESYLLTTFRRRIPVLIELPMLSKRPLRERFRIIKNFFRQESTRMNTNIEISYNVVVALLLYETSGNIGQLRSDIQVACAKGFLKNMTKKDTKIKIEITELSNTAIKGLLKINQYRKEIDNIILGDMEISPDNEKIYQRANETSNLLPKEMYQEIEEKYRKMEKNGLESEVINKIIGDELESIIYQSIQQIKKNKYKIVKQDLEKIVGNKIIDVVEKMMEEIKRIYSDIDETLFYCLATHFAALYKKLSHNKTTHCSRLSKIRTEHLKEYDLARRTMSIASDYLQIDFPEDETAIIAMYIELCCTNVISNENHVGVVVLSHGHVANGMANVANKLLGVNHAKAFEMPIDQSLDISMERVMNIIKESNMGKGVLILADMGSLVGLGKIISDRLSIMTRTIPRVDTLMVIEAVRKALLPDANLDEIADSLVSKDYKQEDEIRKSPTKPSKVIVCICLTGKGTAEIIKKRIQEYLYKHEIEIEIITTGALSEYNVQNMIKNISSRRNILAIVGTINPGNQGIPYIDIKEIISGHGLEKIKDYILRFDHDDKLESNLLQDKLIVPEVTVFNAHYNNKDEIIKSLSDKMVQYGYVQEKFEASVYEREKLGDTWFKGNMALPHGNPEYILKPVIGIVTLESPVEWSKRGMVNCVFMLALNQYHKAAFKEIYKMINKEELLQKIMGCKTFDELKEVLTNK